MRSQRSDSASKPRIRRKNVSIRKVLKRGARYREYRPHTDEKWLWASYKLYWPERTREQFRDEKLPELYDMANRGWDIQLLLGSVNENEQPVGLVASAPVYGDEDKIEPHVAWFHWATRRNRIEAAVNWFDGMRRMVDIFVITTEDNAPFFDHLAAYHVIRKVGYWERWLNGLDYHLYQSRRPS